MERAISTHGIDENFIKNLGLKTSWEETTSET
jgi:hypothetical protein